MEFDIDGDILETRFKGNERILFVDDEELFVSMGSRMLERQGYQVTFKTDSVEALETFRFEPGEFDLVITDHDMPGMSGLELAQKLLTLRPDIPIILCTASSQISEEEAIGLGIRKFLMKPFDGTNLTRTIRTMLDKK